MQLELARDKMFSLLELYVCCEPAFKTVPYWEKRVYFLTLCKT